MSDWFIYPSPNPCVYCRALWFPSSGPLGYLGWHRAWVLLPFPLAHLCVLSHWVLQRPVLILRRRFLLCVICSYSGAPFWAVVPNPHCFAFSLACGFWFPSFFFLFLFDCPEVLGELLTAHGKLGKTFHVEHLLAFTTLSCATFNFIRGS